MKKILYFATGLFIAGLFTGCNVNDQFDGLDEIVRPTNEAKYDYTLTSTDYATIGAAVQKPITDVIKVKQDALAVAANADDSLVILNEIAALKLDSIYLLGASITTNKYFTKNIPIGNFAPIVLNTLFKYGDYKSEVSLTYNYNNINPTDVDLYPIVNRITLTTADYDEMGTGGGQPGQYNSFSASINANYYIPIWLNVKFPYAVPEDVKVITYNFSLNPTTTDIITSIYTYNGENWVITPKTTKFSFTEQGWLLNPTVTLSMVKSDYEIMVNYIRDHPTLSIFFDQRYGNSEYYYGFSYYYDNISFRLSYRDPYFTSTYVQPATIDPELYNLATPKEKVDLLWERLKGGMELFLQLRYPEAVPTVYDIDVEYHVDAKIYYPTGTGGGTVVYIFKYKCTSAGSAGTPPTFEYLEHGVKK